MRHYNKSLRDTFPEIDELIAFKDFLVSLFSKRNSQTKEKVVRFLKTFIHTLKFVLRRLLPLITHGLVTWVVILGLGKSLSYFLNPLGIENYF